MADGELSRPMSAAATAELPGAVAEVLRLLSPRFLAARNAYRRLTRVSRIRFAFLALFGLGFGTAIYFFFHRVLSYFLSVEQFGPILTSKLLSMVFLTFFSILLFSNIITSLSAFFLSADLDRIVAAPVTTTRFFYARLFESVFDSSWMMLLFSVPAFLAYGVVHKAGIGFYLATAVTLPPFLLIPAVLGTTLTTVLVNVFPARRTRDILALLSVVAVALLYLLFRLARPERLVNPEGFSDFMAFLAAMRTPDSIFLPTTWATEILIPFLGLREGRPLFYYLLLASTAGVTLMAGEAVLKHLFLPGWSKAQEGRRSPLTRRAAWEHTFALLTRPFSVQTRLIMVKELKTFFRDTSQWSQLILLLALVVVYIYNFSVLPFGTNPLMTFYFKNVIAFLNLALAGFVIAAVAARFVFPSFSLEGRAFWVVKTAPMHLKRLWWAKFWVLLAPLLVLGEILVVATNSYLRVMPFMMWLSAGTLFGMIFSIVALALATGATYPKFDADNAAKIASGAGGLIYMILCMSFIGAVVILEAWPVYVIFMTRLRGIDIPLITALGIGASLAAVAIVIAGVFIASTRYGLRQLEAIEP